MKGAGRLLFISEDEDEEDEEGDDDPADTNSLVSLLLRSPLLLLLWWLPAVGTNSRIMRLASCQSDKVSYGGLVIFGLCGR